MLWQAVPWSKSIVQKTFEVVIGWMRNFIRSKKRLQSAKHTQPDKVVQDLFRRFRFHGSSIQSAFDGMNPLDRLGTRLGSSHLINKPTQVSEQDFHRHIRSAS